MFFCSQKSHLFQHHIGSWLGISCLWLGEDVDWYLTYIVEGEDALYPQKTAWAPVSAIYACAPLGEKTIPVHPQLALHGPCACRGQTIRLTEPISHNREGTRVIIIPIYLMWKPFSRSEILKTSIDGIREVYILILWVKSDVIQRVELAAKIVVDKNCSSQVSSVQLKLMLRCYLPVVLYGALGFITISSDGLSSP